jgi:two-component system sensor histidine kinase QseC
VRRGLKPLDDLTTEVLSRSPENLSPLAGRAAPREAQPLVAAINRLLFRLNGSLENERRFTADAAHELRTPLAAARVQTQVAMLSTDMPTSAITRSRRRSPASTARRAWSNRCCVWRGSIRSPALPDPTAVDLSQLTRDVVASVLDTTKKCAIEVDIG